MPGILKIRSLSTRFIVTIISLAVTPWASLADLKSQQLASTFHVLAGDDTKAYLGFIPQVTVIDLPIANASARKPNRITITTGLLSLLKDDAELAFVLAHEAGHLRAGSDDDLDGHVVDHEVKADQFALDLMSAAGYSKSAGPAALRRVLYEQTEIVGSKHPTCKLLRERIRRLDRLASDR